MIKFKNYIEESITRVSESADTALKNKAEKSGMPLGILRKVYNRGLAAYKTGHRPGASQHQWRWQELILLQRNHLALGERQIKI